jgi:hypothetical protein
MSVDLTAEATQDPAAAFEYRAVSSAAVSCLALGLLSALATLDWWLALVPAAGVALGVVALGQIRRRREELTGAAMAKIGLVLCVVLWSVGWARLGTIWATEVPDGYQRISYTDLQPDPNIPGQVVPSSAQALDGQKVFVKGFMYPTSRQQGVHSFLLVRDEGTCCFGGNPKITERIQVVLADPKGTTSALGVRKVAGVFRIRPDLRAVDGPGGILYHLEEAQMR